MTPEGPNSGNNYKNVSTLESSAVVGSVNVETSGQAQAIINTNLAQQIPSTVQRTRSCNFDDNVSIPRNVTLGSMGNCNVLLIRPLDPNNRDIIKHPIKFSRAFESSSFLKYPVKQICTNAVRNLVAIEHLDISRPDMLTMIKMRRLGEWDIKCDFPSSDKFKIDVISPVHINENINDIGSYLMSEINIMDSGSRTEIHKIG